LFFLLFLLVCWLIFYTPIWNGERHIGWDLSGHHYPLEHYLFHSLKEDSAIPQWDFYIYNGIDFIGNIPAAIFYLPKLCFYFLLLLLKMDLTFDLYQTFNLTHVLLFSVSVFLITKRFTGSSIISAFASVSIPYSGFFQGQLQHFWFFATICWLPFAILGLYEGIFHQKKIGLIVYIFSSVLMLFAGFPHQFLAVQSFLLLGTFISWFLLRRNSINFRQLLTRIGVSILFITGIASIQLLPFFRLIIGSAATSERSHFPFWSLITFFLPDYYGHLSGNLHVPWDSSLTYFYVGSIGYFSLVPILLLIKRRLQLIHKPLLFALLACLGFLFLFVFTPILSKIKYFLPFAVFFRPWSLATVFISLLLFLIIYLFFLFQNTNRISYYISLSIYVISALTLIVNMPGDYNTLRGSAKLMGAQDMIIANKDIHHKIMTDGLAYSIFVDQKALPFSFLDNWPRIYKIRSIGGYDPSVQKSYLEKLRKGNIVSLPASLKFIDSIKLLTLMTNLSDFQWFRENGVKYFLSRRELVDKRISQNPILKEIYSDPEITIWEIANPIPIFSYDPGCIPKFSYQIASNKIMIDYQAVKKDCTIRSTMNMNSNWYSNDASVSLIPSKDSLGFEIHGLKVGRHSFNLEYRNKFFSYGIYVTIFSILSLTVYWLQNPTQSQGPSPQEETSL
jgi:hypothetical protein